MELFRGTTHINFMAARKVAITASIVVFILAIIAFSWKGLSYGIEFTGGVVVEVTYPEAVSTEAVRHSLDVAGLSDYTVQKFGSANDIVVRLPPQTGNVSKQEGKLVLAALQKNHPGVQEQSVNTVGPQVGSQLRSQGTLAMVVALILIFIYLMVRYEWRLALGGVFATIHDLVFVIGIFSVTGMEFNLNVLAAILAVLGYSVNDTVVIFDRIRENFKRMRRGSAQEIINTSINQTLSRTLMTSGMTMLVVVALLAVGGAPLRGFSITLAIGIAIGTYSSIYVGSATAFMFGVSRQNFAAKKKQNAEADSVP